MITNDQNPINLRRVLPRFDACIEINRTHGEMRTRIEQAFPDSLAMQQVMATQYGMAINDVLRAIDRLTEIQGRVLELAYGNAPSAELDNELNNLGL